MNNPIRVAEVIGKWVGGGVEAVVMNYYRYIDKEKIQFDFIIDEDSTNVPYEEIEGMGGKVILVPPYQNIFKYRKTLKRILKENNYKIVHSHINTMSLFSLSCAKSIKVPIRIAHSHSTTNKKEFLKNLIKNIMRPFSKIYATNYMCCSELAGRWLFGNKAYDNKKVYLLNNAINVEKYAFDIAVRNQKRRELGIDSNTLVVGHVGRFVKQKNHKFLIDMFNVIHIKKPDSLLVLAGQGPLLSDIQRYVKELGLQDNVLFLGQRNDVNDLYQVFDVLCMPSLYEGLPVVGVEAQASGLLCILSSNMTNETKVLKSTVFLRLVDGPIVWANKVLDNYNSYVRVNTVNEMTNGGFNIENECKRLEDYYIDLLKEDK